MAQAGNDVRCTCGEVATLYTSTTEKSAGRQFYRCPKAFDMQCKFFQWLDEPTLSQTLPNPPSTPQKSATNDRGSFTPSPSKLKRSHSLIADGGESGSPSKRFREITAGLQASPLAATSRTLTRTLDNGPSASQETFGGDDGHLVSNALQSLDSVGDYIRKLDRKRIAAEKSRDIKSAMVRELQDEVERLKNREKELLNLLEMYEGGGT